ncbi:MAG TPA: alpha-2-macroglobulin family protein, partial [Polyangia bacterium]
RFTVAKPLQAIPALPRFLSPGDQAQAAVAIHNNTDAKLEVSVSATITGVTVRGASTRKVKVPAHANRRLVFNVSAKHIGEASFLFKAEAPDLIDQVLLRIPVRRAAIPETILVGEGSTQGSATHVLPELGAVIPGQGGLELSIDRTGLGRLDEGLAYLVGYPYGCLEQTTSKVVPMIALAELARNAHLPNIDAGQARHFVEIGVAKILRHQNDEGGFGLWIGAHPEAQYTATGLWGLSVAKAAGFKVDQQALDKGALYLRSHTSKGDQLHATEFVGERGTQAFAEYVLATLHHSDAGALARLYENRAGLPIYGRAFLLRALRAAGRKDLSKSLADELLALAPRVDTGLIEEVKGDLSWYWSSDARTTAMVLWALAEVVPGNPRLAQLSEALLKQRTQGHWGNTQENLFSLLALADLAKVRASAGKTTVSVRLGKTTLAKKTVSALGVEHVFVPLAKLGAGPLVITSESGEIYYSARIRVERPMAEEAMDHGIRIERASLDPENRKPLETIHLGQSVLISLRVSSPLGRAHVAVVDRLPAGFEPELKRFSNEDQWQDQNSLTNWSPARWNTYWQNEELRDDRVQIFADTLAQGQSEHQYLVRATTTGKFVAPPALVEAMYDPAVQGRTATGSVEIVK